MNARWLNALRAAATLLLAAASGAAPAALIARGGGMVYDSEQDITWLQDWGAAGNLYWQPAMDWADNLVHGGYDDWRLPTTAQPDASCDSVSDPGGGQPPQSSGYGCIGGELGYLFYNHLGGVAGQSVLDTTGDTALQMAQLALFRNLHDGSYWSGTSYAPDGTLAWRFDFNLGFQGIGHKVPDSAGRYVVAVRDGDVVSTVPEPTGLALALTALGLALVARPRRAGARRGPDQAAL
jgi:hypothetical protein